MRHRVCMSMAGKMIAARFELVGPGTDKPQTLETTAPSMDVAERKALTIAASHHSEVFGTDDAAEVRVEDKEQVREWYE